MIHNIINYHDARLTTLPEQPTLRTATHEQRLEHMRQFEKINADKVLERFGTDPKNDDDEYQFFTSACHSMLEYEDYWQQADLVFSWIDERPVWLSPTAWWLEVLLPPPHPVLRQLRFSLLGGGQIQVREKFELSGWSDESYRTMCHGNKILKVTADAGDGLHHYAGIVDGIHNEMGADVALFRRGTPQNVADRVAATFRLLAIINDECPSVRGPDRDRFMALLDHSAECCVCHRALRDEVSKSLGIGPDCAKHIGLPHNLAVATRVLKLRRELLGAAAA